ncbi:unnamed protein product [Microthlaspi erraticum]|uniref:Uncharacterized protein n=1 Tax=Microthlaspi erraticum TaxID=1685480 RepID=A0A6D2IJV0_9BRAS|nr:unnamed protein product [Microthlaspi erraticum]CAA7050815.1 unnamed protein product [Microthlaspi erraticum]
MKRSRIYDRRKLCGVWFDGGERRNDTTGVGDKTIWAYGLLRDQIKFPPPCRNYDRRVGITFEVRLSSSWIQSAKRNTQQEQGGDNYVAKGWNAIKTVGRVIDYC